MLDVAKKRTLGSAKAQIGLDEAPILTLKIQR